MKNFLELKHPIDDLQNPPFSFVSDLIEHLQKIKEAHGDLPLAHEYMRGGVKPANPTHLKVAYIKHPREPRTRIDSYRIGNPESTDLKVLAL